MRLDVVTIFPEYFAPLDLSLIGQARKAGLLDLAVHDLRAFTHDRHRTVDDTPYGGGAGMVMTPQPWAEALSHVAGLAPGRPHLLVPAPSGRPFTQALAGELAQEGWLAFACGRYEGIDERVYSYAADDLGLEVSVVSLGDYVLNGGEVAVLAIVEAIARLLPGVIGNAESLVEESHQDGLLEYPVFTKPAAWTIDGVTRAVPDVLLSGDHGAIARWRHQQRLERTADRRPDLLAPAATTETLADLDARVATPADAPEILVLQRACWLPEGRLADAWTVPPLAESLDDVLASLATWTTWVWRSGGRLVASARGRVAPDDPAVWEVARLMVAPDLQGRGLGRQILAAVEGAAPGGIGSFWLNTGVHSVRNQRMYRRAGYRLVPGPPRFEGTVEFSKLRR